MQIAANGYDPGVVLAQVAALGGLGTARDPAAVIDYRLDLTQVSRRTHGPLPWLPGIPTQLLDNPEWETYLTARYVLTQKLAVQTLRTVDGETPSWARHLPGLDPRLLANIRLWRAANNTPDSDLRPTGPTRYALADRDAQRRLDHRLETTQAGIREWTPGIIEAVPALAGNPRLPVLAAKLATLATTRPDDVRILHVAARLSGLPDDHPADALGYRISKLSKRMAARPSTWEGITPGDLAGPRHPEPPPSLQPPDRSPGISF
jgi:hypothetical protein